MLLRHIYEHSLAHSSYLVGSPGGQALVIDPNLDINRYLAAAAAEDLEIVAIAETHIHADFVSGARALAAATGAALHVSGEGGTDWQYAFAAEPGVRIMRHGDVIVLGPIRLEAFHTPGHTPEHLMFVATDGEATDTPIGAFTGDFLFVGDAGRPDLLETAAGQAGTMESSARELFKSLGIMRSLPDHLLIWPAHGSGSVCGKSLSGVPASSLGYERLTNRALRESDERAFVASMLEDQPEPPMYFGEMKQVNRAGPPAWTPGPLPEADAGGIEAGVRDRVLVIDARRGAARGHLPGTIVMSMGHSFPTWGGSVVPPVTPYFIAAADEAQALEARRLLALVGRPACAGWIAPHGIDAYHQAGGTLESLDIVTRPQAGQTMLDVRTSAEWRAGHLAGAVHMPLARLLERAAAFDREAPLLVYCQLGGRSDVAASALRRLGFTHVSTLAGGYNSVMGSGLITTS